MARKSILETILPGAACLLQWDRAFDGAEIISGLDARTRTGGASMGPRL